jgi:hypothetical protein
MDDDVQFIKPLNTLSKAKRGSGPGVMNDDLIARADAVVASMAEDYTEWAEEDLASMQAAVDAIRKNPADHGNALGRLRTISLDMKGQGGTFGFQLITEIGDSLHKFVFGLDEAKELDVKVVESHMNAMKVVMAREIRDDGGPVGRELLKELHRLKDKAAG